MTPAIAISGSVYQNDIERCLSCGFTAHLAKPFDEQSLLEAITRVAQHQARQREAVGNGGIPSPVPAHLR
jgi:CheY-like chemotaxis protein